MFYVGCSGWQYEHWSELFYPREIPKKLWLEYYAKHFNTVEINSTFYHWPSEKTIASWHNRTPIGFKISLKVPRLITHRKRFNNTDDDISQFYQLASKLEEKLGCVLFQLPPSMKFDEEKLKHILRQMDNKFKNVIEFRHSSWFNEKTYSSLSKRNIAFCNVSAPKLPESFRTTASFAYIRFHGRTRWYDYHYSDEELKAWAKKIKYFNGDVYVYFNNDAYAHATSNAKKFSELLGVMK